MFCDMRYATEDSTFGVPVANIGQIPSGGASHRAIQLMGEAKAKEVVFTAGFVGADARPLDLDDVCAHVCEKGGTERRGAVDGACADENVAQEHHSSPTH